MGSLNISENDWPGKEKSHRMFSAIPAWDSTKADDTSQREIPIGNPNTHPLMYTLWSIYTNGTLPSH